MSGNFPLIRHNDFQNWVPETDIDGVDAPRNIVSSIKNFDYRHGYIETAGSLESIALPTNVQTQITAGYSLLSHIYFTHSTQGLTSFSVLWKESATATEKLKCFVNNTELNPDTQNSNVSYSTAPSNINYNVVNDQLKINLNTSATYTDLLNIDPVILNLTLVYIDSMVDYVPNDQTVRTYKDIGWYLFPRWLGWNFNDDGIGIINTEVEGSVIEDFADDNFITGFSYNGTNLSLGTVDGLPTRCIYSEVSNLVSGEWGSFQIDDIVNIKTISFKLWNRGSSVIELMDNPYSVDIYIEYTDINSVSQREYFHEGMFEASEFVNGVITILMGWVLPNGATNANLVFSIYCPKRFDSTALNSVVAIDDLTINAIDDAIIVGVYRDGQRGLLGSGTISIYGGGQLFVKLANIDWRINVYEVYSKISEDGIYYLVNRIEVTANWILDTNQVVAYLVGFTEEEIEDGYPTKTLNFNYNLSATTRVDNQRNIYSEVAHKNRIYFVNGDYKVYQGHISSNLGIQSDAFPYDEEVGFGYFEISHQRINKAVTVSPTNDLVIFTDSGIYVYFIEASSAGAFKQLKMLTGSIGLVSVNSLVKSNSGDPKTDGLFWCDENGIYYYGGGINPPVNLLVGSHEKYWRDSISLSDKQNSVGTYYPKLNEFWLVVGSIIFVFELPYKAFKTYQLSGNPDEFSLASNTLLYCRIDNLLYSYTFTTRSAAEIITHYNTGHNPEIRSNPEVAEIEDKILQEIYMVFGDSDTTTVTMYVYVDDILLGSRIFTTSNNTEKWLMDYGVRFNRIKLKVVTTSGLIRIKEFGCSFVPDFKEQLGR